MIKTISSEEDKVEFCKIAIQNHLYSNRGWGMYLEYNEIINKKCYDSFSITFYIYYIDDKPIGVIRKHGRETWIFVKPKYRRKGIGTALINFLESENIKFKPCYDGSLVSHKFFKALNLNY